MKGKIIFTEKVWLYPGMAGNWLYFFEEQEIYFLIARFCRKS